MERDKRNGPLTIISDRWTRLGRAHGAANGASNSGHGRVFLAGLGALLVAVRRARQPCRGGGSHAGLLLLLLHGWWVGNPWTRARARTHVPVGWMDGQQPRRYVPVKTRGRCAACARPRREDEECRGASGEEGGLASAAKNSNPTLSRSPPRAKNCSAPRWRRVITLA